jgi:hypothetical protein
MRLLSLTSYCPAIPPSSLTTDQPTFVPLDHALLDDQGARHVYMAFSTTDVEAQGATNKERHIRARPRDGEPAVSEFANVQQPVTRKGEHCPAST